MKKTFFSKVVLCALATALFVSCASTPKEPRSIKTTSSKISSVKKAKEIAENYGLKTLCHLDPKDKTIEDKTGLKIANNAVAYSVFIAADDAREEEVVYLLAEDPNVKHGNSSLFVYLSLNGEKSSTLRGYMDVGTLILRNTDKECSFDSSSHELYNDAWKPVTKNLANNRVFFKKVLSQKFGLTFTEEINPEQVEITGISE